MIVILDRHCFDERLESVTNHEMVFDTKDWFLRNYEDIHVLESLYHMDMSFNLTPYGYSLIKDAMIRGDH